MAQTEETVDTSEQQQGADAGSGSQPEEQAKEPEVDLDRAMQDDDYLAQVNERLRGGNVQESAPAQEKAEPQKSEQERAKGEDDDPVVETIVYRGKDVPVRKSQMKDLLQKGRHLEMRMAELSPVLRVLESNPELAAAVREGRLNEWQVTRKAQQQAEREEKLRIDGIEGYKEEDVDAVTKIVDARLQQQREREQKMTNAQREFLIRESERYRQVLADTDPEYTEKVTVVGKIVEHLERTLPREKFQEFYSLHNDPTKIDPNTGKTYYQGLYKAAGAVLAKKRERAAAKSSAVASIPTTPKTAPVTSARIQPGQAGGAASTLGSSKDPWAMSQDAFDREVNQLLRG